MSNEKNLTKIIKRLEKQDLINKEKNQNYIYVNKHLTTINKNIKDENFFLKNFIRDLQYKSDEAHKYNSDVVYNLQLKLEESEQKTKDYLSVNQLINKKLDNSEDFNKKLKKCMANTFKKLYSYQKQNDELIQDNKQIENKYNTLIDEYRCFRRDIEQNIEESTPLLNNNSFPEEYQINKIISYSFANFESAKKIDNKKPNKDNILLFNKTMDSQSKNNGKFPSLLSEIQTFLSKGLDVSQNEPVTTKFGSSKFDTSLNKENDNLKETISDLSNKLNKRENECNNLRYKLENIKTKLNKMQLKMSTSPNRKQEIVSKMLGKTEQLDVTQKEYKKLKNLYNMLCSEYAKLNEVYLNATHDSKLLTQSKEQVNSLAIKIDEMKNELASKEEAIHNTETELKESQIQLENIKNTYQHANTQSNNRISSYQSMISNMQRDLDELKDYKQKYSDLLKKADMDKENYVRKYQQFAKDSLKVNDFKNELDSVKFEDTLNAKTEEIERIQTRLDELSNLESDLIDCQEANKQLNNEVEYLTSKLKDVVLENKSVEMNYKDQSDEHESLIDEHDKLIEDYEKLLDENSELQTKTKYLKNENDELCQDLSSYEDANNQFEKAFKQVQTELEEKTLELEDLQEVYKFTSETRDKLEANVDKLYRENETLKKNTIVNFDNYVMKGEFAALEADYDSLLDKCQALEKTNYDITSEYKDVVETNKEITKENDSLDINNSKITNDRTMLVSEVEKLKSEITNVNTDLDFFKKNYHIASKDLVSCNDSLRKTNDEMVRNKNQLRKVEDSLTEYISGFNELNNKNCKLTELKDKSDESFNRMLSELHDENVELRKSVSIMKPIFESFNKKVEEYDIIDTDTPVSTDVELINMEPSETLEKIEDKNGYFNWFYSKNDNKETTENKEVVDAINDATTL
jgi:chromosome segregation ATPase